MCVQRVQQGAKNASLGDPEFRESGVRAVAARADHLGPGSQEVKDPGTQGGGGSPSSISLPIQ